MRKGRRIVRTLVAATTILSMTFGMLTGCGSTSSESNADTTQADTTASADGKTRVIAGMSSTSVPWSYYDENGNIIGYNVEVVNALNERLENYYFDIEVMDFSTLIVSLDSGAVDMIINNLVRSEARKEKYLFTDQYYCLSPMVLAQRKGANIKSFEDMNGMTITQTPSAYEYSMILRFQEEMGLDDMVINTITDISAADKLKRVANGTDDVALVYRPNFDSMMEQLDLDLEISDVVIVEDTYPMFAKDDEALCAEVDAALKSMIEDGTLSKIATETFGEDIFTLYGDKITSAETLK